MRRDAIEDRRPDVEAVRVAGDRARAAVDDEPRTGIRTALDVTDDPVPSGGRYDGAHFRTFVIARSDFEPARAPLEAFEQRVCLLY